MMNGSHKAKGLRLDLGHGFLKNIRSCLRARAVEEGFVREGNASSTQEDMSSETGSYYQPPSSTQSSPLAPRREASVRHHIYQDLPMATTSDTDNDSDAASLPSQLELTSTERSLLQLADLSRFTSTAQMYIRRAMLKPRSLSEDPLSDVGRVLVERSCRDSNYYAPAANVIRHIYQMAGINNPLSEAFLRSVTAECYSNLLSSSDEQLSPATREQRHNSVLLMCELHRLFRQSGLPTDVILTMLHTAVCEVATAPCCLHPDEIRFLKSNVQQYGDDFLLSFTDSQIEVLLDAIRSAFLMIHFVVDVEPEEKRSWSKDLLFIIELLVGQFALKMEAKKFYFDSVAVPFQ